RPDRAALRGFEMSRETWEGVLMQKTLWWFAVLALLAAPGCRKPETPPPTTVAPSPAAPSPAAPSPAAPSPAAPRGPPPRGPRPRRPRPCPAGPPRAQPCRPEPCPAGKISRWPAASQASQTPGIEQSQPAPAPTQAWNSAALHHRAQQERQRGALRCPAHRRRQTRSQGTGDRLLGHARQGRPPAESQLDREEEGLWHQH